MGGGPPRPPQREEAGVAPGLSSSRPRARSRRQTANEDPQPQLPTAFGLLNLKPAPCMPRT